MSYGPNSVFYKTMASGGTSTSGYDLTRSWTKVYLEVPSLTSNTEFYIQGSSDGTTFRRVADNVSRKEIATFTATASSIGTLTQVYDLGPGTLTNRYLSHPSFTTSSQLFIQGSNDNVTFRRLTQTSVNSSTVSTNDYVVQSGTSVRWAPIPDQFRYVKVEIGTGVTQVAHSFTIIGTQEQRASDFRIPSAITNRIVPIPNTFRYLKVETSATVDDGARFNIICSD